MLNKRTVISLALLAVMPAVLSAAPISNVLSASLTISIPTIDDYFAFIGCTSSPCSPASAAATGISGIFQINNGNLVPSVTGFNITESVPGNIVAGYFTAIGLNAPGEGDVVVGLPGSIPSAWPFATAESSIITDLTTGNTGAITTFLSANFTSFLPYSFGTISSGNIGEFSGTQVGTFAVSLTATPEPGTFALTAVLLTGVFLIRRRRATH